MNEGMTSQKNQREYLKHLKDSGLIIGTFLLLTFTTIAILDYILL